LSKLWFYSKLFWVGVVGFLGYGADTVLDYMQNSVLTGCAKRSAVASLTFAVVTYLRLKTNTGLTNKKELQ
jgi:hypothetical protein